MKTAPTCRSVIATEFLLVAALLACSETAPPTPTLETLALSLDSIAIQFRDSASELTASPRGALGVELEADVMWRSKNEQIVAIVPNGKTVRLVPVRPGTTEVEASAEHLIATAKVVVLDTVFSVAISAPDTIVSLGGSLRFTATVTGPPGTSRDVAWRLTNPAAARIDSSQGKNPVLVVSLDTGSTEVVAASAIDRNKSARAPFSTARPVALFFDWDPGHPTAMIRANDRLIPGPVVGVRDALGNAYPGNMDISMLIEPGTGRSGAALFGNPVVPYAGSEVAFNNLLFDSAGTGFRLKATSPGIASATSPVFTVGPECPGIPYSIGHVVSGTLTTDSCRSNTNEYYVRYTVSASSTQLISAIPPSPARWGVVFRDGTRAGAQTDTTPHLASGNYSIRIYSGPNGELGDYQLRSKFAFLTKITETPSAVWTCWRIQAHVGIEYSEELRCGGGGVLHACGATGLTNTMGSLFRLWLQANASATITASSSQIDPCIEVTTGDVPVQQIAIDDNSGGGTTARVVLPPSPNGRNVIIIVSGRPPIPASSMFTIKIER